MPSIHPEDLSPFGRLALKLDREFAELTKAGGQMSKVDLESDSGLDEGIKILNKVAAYGQSIAETMQEFSTSLQETRDAAEAATQLVAERAQVIKQRKLRQDELEQKMVQVKEDVKAVGASLSGFSMPAKDPSEEDRRKIAAELERLQAPLTGFIEAAQALKGEAAGGNFKRLERQADAMIDSLQATRRKIAQVLGPK